MLLQKQNARNGSANPAVVGMGFYPKSLMYRFCCKSLPNYKYEMMKGMHHAWVSGKHVTIDENMIKYMGRAVSFVQYMPAKPIKHGTKVFCLCCAVSAVLLSFAVYVGKEDEQRDNSALAVCNRLVIDAGLTE